MPQSYIEYNSGLTETTFSVPFKYISIDDVYALGYDGTYYKPLTIASRDASANTITLDSAPQTYTRIRVYRATSTTQLVDFQNGSRLSEADLDTAYQQGLFVAQEVSEDANTNQWEKLAEAALLANTSLTEFSSSTHTGDGTEVTFDLSFTPKTSLPQAFLVIIDGVLQSPVDAYTLSINPAQITFTSAPPLDSEIVVTTTAAATGAVLDNLDVTATGSTEPRSISDRFADTVNVKDFGAKGDGVTDDTAAIQAAFTAAAGSDVLVPMGNYIISATVYIPAGTTVRGEGRYSRWSDEDQGTRFTTTGAGNAQRWTDVTGSDPDDDTPLFVAQGDGVRLQGVSLFTDLWSMGVLFPTVKQCGFSDIYATGFTDGCIYLDATWSDRNTTMQALYPSVTPSTGMNEFQGENFYLIGGGTEGFGIKIQGTTRAGNSVANANDWQWGWGGTSDLQFSNGRLGATGGTGGCFSHDAQLFGTGSFGQTIAVRDVSLRLSGDGLYAVKLDRSNRILFDGCYAESVGNNQPVFAVTSNTQSSVDGILRVNDKMNTAIWLDGSDTGDSSSNTPWETTRCITTHRWDGRVYDPNLTATTTNTPVRFKSFENSGQFRFASVDQSAVTDYLRVQDSVIRPEISEGMSLGSALYPFSRVNCSEIILDSANNIKTVTGEGSPEGIIVAGIGSTYHQSNGGAGTTLYVKESGTGNTGWIAK